MLRGLIDETVNENNIRISVWDEALPEGKRMYKKINT